MSDRAMTVCSDASAPDAEFGPSDRLQELQANPDEELLEQPKQRKHSIARMIAPFDVLQMVPEGEPGEFHDVLEDTGSEDGSARTIAQTEFHRMSTPFDVLQMAPEAQPATKFHRMSTPFNALQLVLPDSEPGEFDDASEDTGTPEEGRTRSSSAQSPLSAHLASISSSSSLTASVSAWAEDSACSVCALELGKRKFRLRHHCRICGGSVCASCSTSTVRLEGEKSLQRVCNHCILNVQVGPVLRERLDNLSDQLNIIGSDHSPMNGTADNLEDAVRRCESTLPGLQHETDNHKSTKAELQEVRSRLAFAELLPGLEHEINNHRNTKAELQEVRSRLAAAETPAMQGEIKRLSKDNTDLTSKLERALADQGRLEELVAELRNPITQTESQAAPQNAAILCNCNEKLRAAEAQVDKFQAKEASERLQRQRLATDLRELREAHEQLQRQGLPTDLGQLRKLSAELVASALQVVEAELQEARTKPEHAKPQIVKLAGPADSVRGSVVGTPTCLCQNFAWPFGPFVRPMFITRLLDLSRGVAT